MPHSPVVYEDNGLTVCMNKAIDMYITALEEGGKPVKSKIAKSLGKTPGAWWQWMRIGKFRRTLMEELERRIGLDAATELSARITNEEVPTSDLVKLHLHDKEKKVALDITVGYEQFLKEIGD